jgi:hypothetical protein
VILEAEVAGSHGRCLEGDRALRAAERFDHGGEVVGGGQAVADEEDAEWVPVLRPRTAMGANRAKRKRDCPDGGQRTGRGSHHR